MIQYFKNIEGQTVEIDKPDTGAWVNLVPPFKEEEFIELEMVCVHFLAIIKKLFLI